MCSRRIFQAIWQTVLKVAVSDFFEILDQCGKINLGREVTGYGRMGVSAVGEIGSPLLRGSAEGSVRSSAHQSFVFVPPS